MHSQHRELLEVRPVSSIGLSQINGSWFLNAQSV